MKVRLRKLHEVDMHHTSFELETKWPPEDSSYGSPFDEPIKVLLARVWIRPSLLHKSSFQWVCPRFSTRRNRHFFLRSLMVAVEE